MKDNFLLKNKTARRLYEKYAKSLPIIDFHNHISANDLSVNREFKTLTEIWITPDPYKHRLMRICGVDEYYITGKATDYEKFEKFLPLYIIYKSSRDKLRKFLVCHTENVFGYVEIGYSILYRMN